MASACRRRAGLGWSGAGDAASVTASRSERFCDLQVVGPFSYWCHCHRFAAERQLRHTRITDDVDYAWLAGPLNSLVDALGGRLQLRRIFYYRQQQTLRLLQQSMMG